ncbi:MAG: DUF1295 domain-containing protein [Salinivirgaceae bacterium]|jgi:steroid 5-alpha reductase family enzyme|nr:DUF1295 domain-containing protein [Salinivirgaceae bacterium]
MELLHIALKGFLIVMILLTIIWVISVALTNASIIDPFWGMGILVLALWYAYAGGNWNLRSFVVIVMVTLWALRLSLFLFIRNSGKGEDYRYQNFRKDFGPERYWWVSFFQVFLLQGILMAIVSLPLLGTFYYANNATLGLIEYAGIIIYVIGFLFETIGDNQLTRFKRNPLNKGKVLNTGVWRYTRHPNYFGESFIWWGFGIYCLGTGTVWPLIGSAFMMLLLLKVSGVSLLERTLKTSKPGYEEYISSTSSFFPWFPKKLV